MITNCKSMDLGYIGGIYSQYNNQGGKTQIYSRLYSAGQCEMDGSKFKFCGKSSWDNEIKSQTNSSTNGKGAEKINKTIQVRNDVERG